MNRTFYDNPRSYSTVLDYGCSMLKYGNKSRAEIALQAATLRHDDTFHNLLKILLIDDLDLSLLNIPFDGMHNIQPILLEMIRCYDIECMQLPRVLRVKENQLWYGQIHFSTTVLLLNDSVHNSFQTRFEHDLEKQQIQIHGDGMDNMPLMSLQISTSNDNQHIPPVCAALIKDGKFVNDQISLERPFHSIHWWSDNLYISN